MRFWLFAGGAVGAYATALIALAPAALVDAGLDAATKGRMRLTAPEGSIWMGRGRLELRDPDTRGGMAKPIAWRVQSAALLRGRIGFEVHPAGADQPFAVTISWGRLELSAARLNFPAAALSYALPQLAALAPTGNVTLEVPAAVWENGTLNGDAALRWSTAGSAFAARSPLGTYELKVAYSGLVAHAALSTLEGALELSGSGAWTIGERPRFRASARVPPAQRGELAPLLRLVGVEREAGRFELELK